MLAGIVFAAAVAVAVLVWLAILGLRVLRTFVRSFWPH